VPYQIYAELEEKEYVREKKSYTSLRLLALNQLQHGLQ